MNETAPQNQPPQPPASPAQPQLPVAVPQIKPQDEQGNKGFPKSPYLYALLTFLLGVGAGYLLVAQFPGNKIAETANDKPQSKQAVTLPGDAIKVQACVNQKGELHAVPKDLPQGPLYIVDKEKVVGLEYVFTKEDFEKGKINDQLNTLNAGINHMQVASTSAGFDGKPGSFYVVDLYLVDKKTKVAITCDIPTPSEALASPSAATVSTTPEISFPQTVISPATLQNF